ncbi:MAG: ATPase [Sphaerochaetaceae bacterium]
METTDNRLLIGILEQAEKTAQKKIEDAKNQAARITDEAQSKIDKEITSLRKEFEQKIKSVELKRQANIATAKRKANLRQIDENYLQVLRRVNTLLDSNKVAQHLPMWIAEAAIGLDLKEAKVSYSRQCPVDEKHLAQAMFLVERATGAKVTLHLDPKPVQALGVIVSSMDDTVSFNNQVEIRLRRFDRVVRSMIQEHT